MTKDAADQRPPEGSEVTHEDVAAETFLATGEVVTTEAVTAALTRAGIVGKLRRRN